MKLIFGKEETLTPLLEEGTIDIDKFFDACAEHGNSSTMITLATGLGFGFQQCKEFARRRTFGQEAAKLVYYEGGRSCCR